MKKQRLILVRDKTTDQGTTGFLYWYHQPIFRTLELPWRDNQKNVSCIPAGEYLCVYSYSPRFQKYFYEIKGVSGRTEILIHSGNYAGDKSKGFKTDVEGCILLGQKIVQIGGQMMLTKSRDTITTFHTYMEQRDFILDVV